MEALATETDYKPLGWRKKAGGVSGPVVVVSVVVSTLLTACAVLLIILIATSLTNNTKKSNNNNNPEPATMVIINTSTYDVAIRGNQIVGLGVNLAATTYVNSATRVIDAKGGKVMPGIYDNHIHLGLGSAFASEEIPLVSEAADEEDLVRRLININNYQGAASTDSLVVMGGAYFPNITRHHLDRVSTTRIVAVLAYDYHVCWVNTYALNKVGLLRAISQYIPLESDGTATGELRETAGYGALLPYLGTTGAIITHKLTAITPENAAKVPISGATKTQLKRWLKNGFAILAAQGITSVQQCDGDRSMLELYDEMESEGNVPIRINIGSSLYQGDYSYADKVIVGDRSDVSAKIRAGSCKFWLDGILEARTAYVWDYYPGTTTKGVALWDQTKYIETITKCDNLNLRVITHCVGDACVSQALDAYESVMKSNGVKDRRWSIEHIELLKPSDAARFAKLGVTAGMQPQHIAGTDNEPWTEGYIDKVPVNRYNDSFAWNHFYNAGARLAWGSDWPVVDPTAIRGMMRVVKTRLSVAGLTDTVEDGRLPMDAAIEGYTHTGAWLQKQDGFLGSIKVGYLADIVVLSTAEISEATVPLYTICDGKITYQK